MNEITQERVEKTAMELGDYNPEWWANSVGSMVKAQWREAAKKHINQTAALRAKLAEAEAAASVMREALESALMAGTDPEEDWNVAAGKIQQALSHPAGKDLLEKVGRYEAALKKISEYDGESIWNDDRDDAADDMLIIAQEALTQQTPKEL